MLPSTTGVKPIISASRARFMITPGWSPSASVNTTPAASARTFRIGPSVQSSSAFRSTRCFPLSIAETAVCAELDLPVASTMHSMPSAAVTSIGSSVIARWPRSIAAASCAAEDTLTKSSMPMSVKALAASVSVRLATTATSMPGVACSTWWTNPRPANRRPTPTVPDYRRPAGLQGLVDDDHDELLSSRRSAQLMSFSETITPSAIGQSIPRAGSSQRMPVSAPGCTATRRRTGRWSRPRAPGIPWRAGRDVQRIEPVGGQFDAGPPAVGR